MVSIKTIEKDWDIEALSLVTQTRVKSLNCGKSSHSLTQSGGAGLSLLWKTSRNT